MDENLDLPLEDDILQNFEYYYANHTSFFPSPEKNLMISVLLYGILDFIAGKKNADEWFFDENDHLYSLKTICLTLDIEITKFKEKIIELKKKSNKINKVYDMKDYKTKKYLENSLNG